MKFCALLLTLSIQWIILASSVCATEIIPPIVPEALPTYNEKQVKLGQLLFSEKALSTDNSLSCASCHFLERATADGMKFSLNNKGKPMPYNTPSLNYTTLNQYYTWTGKFHDLKQHLDGLINNPTIFNIEWPTVVKRLNQAGYSQQFKEAGYPKITADNIFNALLIFEKSLVQPSRFDLFILGDNNQLTKQEQRGYQLFKDYGCIACHQGKNIGGNMRQKFGVIYQYYKDTEDTPKRDLGYYNISGQEADKFYFRVPSLRNVAKTAPYFHDASAETLEEAIKVMGKYQLGLELEDKNIKAIESFLKSLDAIQ